jgi:superfamily I DNA/RNA helicase
LVLKHLAEDVDKGFPRDLSINEVYEMFARVKERAKVAPDETIETLIKQELESNPKTGRHSSWTLDSASQNLGLYLKLFKSYSDTLDASSALDFTDILTKGLDLFRAVHWARELTRLKHVLVDELYVLLPWFLSLELIECCGMTKPRHESASVSDYQGVFQGHRRVD